MNRFPEHTRGSLTVFTATLLATLVAWSAPTEALDVKVSDDATTL